METHSLYKCLSKESFSHFLHFLHYFLKISLCLMILISWSFIFTKSLYSQISAFSQEFNPSDQSQPVSPFDPNGFFRARMKSTRKKTTASDILKSLGDPELLRIYVKWDATGIKNGSSWEDAYTGIQDAIDGAPPGRPAEILED